MKYFDDNDDLIKSSIVNDLRHYDTDLLNVLLKDNFVLDEYSKTINGETLFNFQSLIELFKYHNFWQDSYTKFSNKVGLTNNGNYLSNNSDVVLNFPFKDTVLKGGMAQEDESKRDTDEPFLNETIARNQINEMFEPKALIHAKKYDQYGQHHVDNFTDQDNLILKGNNLIALHSLKQRYAGKIKLIYIDPPYNTGNDAFEYNDNFNHSTWLLFMKNRLEIAKAMLKENGMIFIQCDNNESAYLKVLMDEIFLKDNYITTISVKSNSIHGSKVQNKNKTILQNTNYIHVYAKNSDIIKQEQSINPQYIPKNTWDTHYNFYINDWKKGEVVTLKKKLIEQNIISENDTITSNIWNTNKEFRNFVINEQKNIMRNNPEHNKNLKNKSLNQPNKLLKINNKGTLNYLYKGGFMSSLSNSLHPVNGVNVPAYLLGNLWTDISFDNTQNEGGISFPSGKKPERLLKRIISMATNKNDIVLDFFMGSATTQAVAMKMHRRFIGIEQMDYINTVSIPRLQKVIDGEQGGISKDINWHGDGSFVYAKLMDKNQQFVNALENATSQSELDNLYEEIKNYHADLDIHVDLNSFETEKDEHSFVEQKKILIQIINKNQLYYNYHNLDDEDVKGLISRDDYKFNQSFYNRKGDE